MYSMYQARLQLWDFESTVPIIVKLLKQACSKNRATYASWSSASEPERHLRLDPKRLWCLHMPPQLPRGFTPPAGTHCFSGRVSVVRKAKPPPQTMVKSTLPINVLISARPRGKLQRGYDQECCTLGLRILRWFGLWVWWNFGPLTRVLGKHVTTYTLCFFKNQAFNPFPALQCGLVTGCVPTTLPIFSKKFSKQRSTAPHPSGTSK